MSSTEQHPPGVLDRLSLPEAALELHLTYMAAYRLALTGRLAAARINGHWAITREALERYKAEQLAASPVAGAVR